MAIGLVHWGGGSTGATSGRKLSGKKSHSLELEPMLGKDSSVLSISSQRFSGGR